jgi:hypothetical protein
MAYDVLYYGDNLNILRRCIRDESTDSPVGYVVTVPILKSQSVISS